MATDEIDEMQEVGSRLTHASRRGTMQTMEGYAVGWFTLSLINAGLAQAGGRSALAWWLLSLLLGPVATLLMVLLGPVRPPRIP